MRDRSPRPGLFLAGAVACALLVAACGSGKPVKFDTQAFATAIFQPDQFILAGIGLTVSISVISQFIGIVLGVFGALGRLSKRRAARWLTAGYLWVFRGTPLLVQLVFFYFGLGAVHLYDWNAIDVAGITIPGAIQAGIFALGLNEGAYMTEIIRAGILSIDPGQMEAAKSVGMTYGQAMRRIVLPQAARIIVPPLGNEFNNMLKTTALLFVLGVQELYNTFVIKQGNNFLPFEMYLACALWFLLLTTIWGVFQGWMERRLARGTAGSEPSSGPGLGQRLFGFRGGEP
ncbi:MAG TPA: amino acid ABC transporter permease, partial [Candidatus Baltobacteraceae bacterium]|nr:amino acid ABC transporter permease [Candidatus Baltobacteraceae bacterium]